MTQLQNPSQPLRYSQTIRREIRHRARREGILLLFGNTPISALLTIPLTLMIAAWMQYLLDPPMIELWLVVVIMSVLLRFILYRIFTRRETLFTTRTWENAYSIVMAFTGLAWGSFAWIGHNGNLVEISTIILIKSFLLLAVIVIASSTLLGSRLAFISFLFGITTPLICWLIYTGTWVSLTFFVSMLAVAILLFLNYQMQHRSLLSAFVKRYEARELFKQQQVIFETVIEGIVLIRNHPERIVKCNRRFAKLFGLAYETVRTNPPWVWYGSRAAWKQLMVESLPIIAAGQPYQTRRQFIRKGAAPFWAEITGTAIDPQNLDTGVVWVVTDIDVKLAAENALRLSEQRFRDLMSLSSDAYWVLDENAYILQLTGDSLIRDHIPTDQLLGHQIWGIPAISGVTDVVWRTQKTIFTERKPFRDFIFQIKGTDRKIRWFSASGMPLFDLNNQFAGYHGIATNITSRILNEERYRHLAYHDTLTGLPNRRLLEDRLEQAIQVALRKNYLLGLLVVDLDEFKPVNDVYGHAVGDILLEQVALLLRRGTRQMDTVSRIGGDEFVILLPELNSQNDAVVVARKIHQLFTRLTLRDYPEIKIGASIGISIFPLLSNTADDLFLHADIAMYIAKSEGGHCTRVYEPQWNQSLPARNKLL